MLARYTFTQHDAEVVADRRPQLAPVVRLRARSAKMDAITRWAHGNEGFQVKNAVKALRDAMDKAKSHQ